MGLQHSQSGKVQPAPHRQLNSHHLMAELAEAYILRIGQQNQTIPNRPPAARASRATLRAKIDLCMRTPAAPPAHGASGSGLVAIPTKDAWLLPLRCACRARQSASRSTVTLRLAPA